VATRIFQVPHYQKKFDSVQPKAKEKASFESFTLFFGTWQILSRSRLKFEALL
jgi:hypothetical protein